MLGGGTFLGSCSAFFLEASGSANMLELSKPLLLVVTVAGVEVVEVTLEAESASMVLPALVVLLFVTSDSPTGLEVSSELT